MYTSSSLFEHYRMSHLLVDLGWVGFTLIWVFHHLAQLPSRFCQIPISPGRIGQTVEHSKFKSTQPSLEHMGHPVIGLVIMEIFSIHRVLLELFINCRTAKLLSSQVVVKSLANTAAIDLESVLFLEKGSRTLGRVFDVFGPVSRPFYAVRCRHHTFAELSIC